MEERLAGRGWFGGGGLWSGQGVGGGGGWVWGVCGGLKGWVGGIMSREREQVGGGVDVVSVRSLVKMYGDRPVLGGVDLGVESGVVFGLLGPNGGGKSTLLETVAGVRRPTSGSVTVLGFDPRRDRKEVTRLVSVQPQSASVFGFLTVLETLRLYASFHEDHRGVRETIEQIGLVEQEQVQARNLSGGQLRRLLVGVALIGRPRLVILDEPSAGLDPEARQQLLGIISSLQTDGPKVVFSTHDMTEATQICDRVVIIAEGQIRADGAPSRLIEEAGGASTLHFDVVTSDALERAQALLDAESLSWVKNTEGFHLSYTTTDPDRALELLTSDRQIRGRRYRVEHLTLEDFYLSIVRETRTEHEKTTTEHEKASTRA